MAPGSSAPRGDTSKDDYRLLDELDRLEELLEEMEELGVASRTEIEARIATLEAQVGDIEPDPAGGE